MDLHQAKPLYYQGELMGPVGATRTIFERVRTTEPLHTEYSSPYTFFDFRVGRGRVRDPKEGKFKRKDWDLKKPNQLALAAISDPTLVTVSNLREYVRGWRFYNSFHIDNEKIRKSVPTSQDPVLHEDAGNLSAVLFNLMTEHPEAFEELNSVLKSAIPGFGGLTVKARGGPGEVIAFWQERSIDTELSLADLSDGTLRFLAWATVSVMPSPPTLICVDEPDQGVHPRTLPILGALFAKAARRTQIILATHSSYFLTQFDVRQIGVMKKENGRAVFVKITDSRTLLDNLDEFGSEELEKMHRTDELEGLA